MGDVKRYEAVHLRYDDNNIRYGDGCEVEVVLASDYATIEAENANLRAGSDLLLEDLDRRDSTVGLLQAENAKLRAELERRAVPDGFVLAPVKPTEEMLIAGDGYIGTPATYKAMISAIPNTITTEFSQFLSAVMDAAGLVRHGRQSKGLSEYLGSQCMKYRLSAAPYAPKADDPVKVQLLEALEELMYAHTDKAEALAEAAIAAARQEGGKV